MEKHEASCYSNPKRKCHACFNRDEYRPVAIEDRAKPITSIGNECPYCLMNMVFKFNKEHKHWELYVWYDLDQFRKDKSAWENENRGSVYQDTGVFTR